MSKNPVERTIDGETKGQERKPLAEEMTEMKAAMYDELQRVKRLSNDVIKLRAEVISMGERVRPDEIAKLYFEIRRNRKERNETFRQLAEWIDKRLMEFEKEPAL